MKRSVQEGSYRSGRRAGERGMSKTILVAPMAPFPLGGKLCGGGILFTFMAPELSTGAGIEEVTARHLLNE